MQISTILNVEPPTDETTPIIHVTHHHIIQDRRHLPHNTARTPWNPLFRTPDPNFKTQQPQRKTHITIEYLHTMPEPTETTPPLEYSLYHIYHGHFQPLENFNDIPLIACTELILHLPKHFVKSKGIAISKFTREYKNLNNGEHPKLYNICHKILHQFKLYKSEGYKNFIEAKEYKYFEKYEQPQILQPPELYSDSDINTED